MKEKLLQFLRCPSCSGTIQLNDVTSFDGREILAATLRCSSCDASYPVLRGVPRFASLTDLDADKAATAENFGWQWQHFTQADKLYDEQFLGWIKPVDPDFFRGKLVLEGGCGKGRHTELASAWGAQEVIGVDLSDAVETAFANTRLLENAHVIQADINHLPLARVFDYAFSIGVLHHMPDPRAGFVSLASKVREGGHLSAWVYGAENNQWLIRFVDPIRQRATSRMGKTSLLNLSKIPTAVLYTATKMVYGPLNRSSLGKRVANKLFYNDYLSSIAKFGWREQHTIVFDHLVAPTSYYISREEFESWWRNVNATEVVIGWHNKNSWRGFGKL